MGVELAHAGIERDYMPNGSEFFLDLRIHARGRSANPTIVRTAQPARSLGFIALRPRPCLTVVRRSGVQKKGGPT